MLSSNAEYKVVFNGAELVRRRQSSTALTLSVHQLIGTAPLGEAVATISRTSCKAEEVSEYKREWAVHLVNTYSNF